MYSTTSSTRLSFVRAMVFLGLLPTTALADWTGGYAGLSLGALTQGEATAEIDGQDQTITFDGDAISGGFAGYQIQQGNFVFGGELAISVGRDFESGSGATAATSDLRFVDIKGRAGYDLGNTLVYGVVGLSQINITNDLDGGQDETDEGINFGFGADYRVNDQFRVGAEYLARHVVFEDDESPIEVDVDADTLSLRASFNF